MCRKCGGSKTLEDFTKSRSCSLGRSYTCKACQKLSARTWYRSNLESAKELSRIRYHEDVVSSREAVRASYDKYREDRIARVRAWQARNPGRVSALRRRREVAPPISPWARWEDVYAIYRHCKGQTYRTGVPHEVDHIYPLLGKTVCGLNCPDNLRVIPSDVNRRKGNKLPGFLRDELWDPEGVDVFYE